MNTDALYLVALSQVSGMSSRVLRCLLEVAGTPTRLALATQPQLEGYFQQVRAGKVPTDLQTRAQAQMIVEMLTLQAQDAWVQIGESFASKGIQVICWGEPDYPPLLAQIYDPPVVLYIKGNPQALVGKTLGFVGTRRASDYGQQATDHLIADLAPHGVTVVSGLAQGIDGAAHKAALRHGLPTVAVFGTGLSTIFPVMHKPLADQIVAEGGTLLSEYPPEMPGNRHTFPKRNRIIAGLSHGVVVVEGGQKSGSLITARLALEESRSVFAVPGNLFSPGSAGPHHLLKNGAVLTTEASDILADLRWLPADARPEPATEQLNMLQMGLNPPNESSQSLLSFIAFDPMPIDLVAQRAALSMEQIGPQLTLLELHGQIALLPGAKVCRR